MSIAHPFREGERVHFTHELDLAAGLRHGYLEHLLMDDTGFINRVIRYQPESDTYHWYEAPMGMTPLSTKQHTYATLEELFKVHDVHVYTWYPLFPKGYQYQHQAGMMGTGSFELLKQFVQSYPDVG